MMDIEIVKWIEEMVDLEKQLPDAYCRTGRTESGR